MGLWEKRLSKHIVEEKYKNYLRKGVRIKLYIFSLKNFHSKYRKYFEWIFCHGSNVFYFC